MDAEHVERIDKLTFDEKADHQAEGTLGKLSRVQIVAATMVRGVSARRLGLAGS
jgi:hypothetical protein